MVLVGWIAFAGVPSYGTGTTRTVRLRRPAGGQWHRDRLTARSLLVGGVGDRTTLACQV